MTQHRSESLPPLKFCGFRTVTNAGKGNEELLCGLRVARKGPSEKVTFARRLYVCERNRLEASGCDSSALSSVDVERGLLHSAALGCLYCRSRVLRDSTCLAGGRGEAGPSRR